MATTTDVQAKIGHDLDAAICNDAESQMSTRTRTLQWAYYCGGSKAEANVFPVAG